MDFKTKTIEETQLIYSILRDRYPDRQIEIVFDDRTKEYSLSLTKEKYTCDPEVPLDVKIKVIYGDSVTGDTPLLLKKDNQIYIETIQSIFNEKDHFEYPGFKLFEPCRLATASVKAQTIRLEKEYSLSDYQVWSDIGWVDIKKVIRHRCEKKIYRVLTHTGCVDVTEDHSLIGESLEPVKPGELKIGDSLLHSFPTEFNENKTTIVKMKKTIDQTKTCNTCNIEKDINEFYKNNLKKDGRMNCDYYKNSWHPLRNVYKNFKLEDYNLTEKEAEVWGFFQGDGSCGTYNCKSGIKNSWALNNSDLKRLNYFKDILESVEPIKFEILDTLKSSGVYKLVPKGSIKYMVDKYRDLFYYQKDCNGVGDKYKIVPNYILNASKEIKMAYWKGYYEADGAKTCGKNIDNPSFAVKGKIGAQCMYYLMRSIGFDICINLSNHQKKKEMYFLSYTNFKYKKETVIKKIIEKDVSDDYVYDLETSIGRFGAGVGQLHTFNTDSIFLSVKFNRDDFEQNRKDTFDLSVVCGNNLTNDVFKRPPIELEFEKVYQPFILLTKKRYIGKKFEDLRDPMKLKTVTTAGIALTRRDYCLMVKRCYKEIIDTVMEGNSDSLEKSLDIFKDYIKRIKNYKIPFDDLVVSAMLAKNYSCALCKEKCEWNVLKCTKTSCRENNVAKRLPNCRKCGTEFKCIHTFSLAHVNLAVTLLKRNEEIQVNDRIQYLFVENGKGSDKKADLAEDPRYAVEHNLKANRVCYLEQLAKPILGFYKIVLKDQPKLLDDTIDYVNDHLVGFGGKKLRPSDFKIEEI